MRATHILHIGRGQVFLLANIRPADFRDHEFQASAKRVVNMFGDPVDEDWRLNCRFARGRTSAYTLLDLKQPRVPLRVKTLLQPLLQVEDATAVGSQRAESRKVVESL